ncbi:MAG TPA: RloB domain-containing protein [Waddliaceae bacterium]
MTRRISIRSFRKPNALYSPLDLVVCEGETEVDYLSELARYLRIHVHMCKGDGTDPKSIVNTAKRKSKEDGVKYDKIFINFFQLLIKLSKKQIALNMLSLLVYVKFY